MAESADGASLVLVLLRLRHGMCGAVVSAAADSDAQSLLHYLSDIQLGCHHGGYAAAVRRWLVRLLLIALASAVLVRWELAALRHPERFDERTNARLSCAQCDDKLCYLRGPFRLKREERVDLLELVVSTEQK